MSHCGDTNSCLCYFLDRLTTYNNPYDWKEMCLLCLYSTGVLDIVLNTQANGSTHLSLGLELVYNELFQISAGMRPLSQGVPRVLITLTDGKSNPHFEPYEWAHFLQNQRIEMFSVGMAGSFNYLPELEALASYPIDQHMFQVGYKGDLLS